MRNMWIVTFFFLLLAGANAGPTRVPPNSWWRTNTPDRVAAKAKSLAARSILTSDSSHGALDMAWGEWKAEHNKSYASARDDAAKKQLFVKNLWDITEANVDDANTFWLSANQFADADTRKPSQRRHNRKSLQIDWNFLSYNNHVSNQGSCDASWIFAPVSMFESKLIIGGHISPIEKLSEQHVLDCLPGDGCAGGSVADVLAFMRNNYVIKASHRPYTGQKGSSCPTPSSGQAINRKVHTFTSASGTALSIDQELYRGPVVVLVDSSFVFLFYSGGVINSNSCGTAVDHAVTIVNNDGNFWTVKNSWGTAWGESGNARIAKSSSYPGICGVQTTVYSINSITT